MDKRWMRLFKLLFVTNAKEFLRDRRSLITTLVMPTSFLIIFGLVRAYAQSKGMAENRTATMTRPDYFLFIMPALLSLGLINLSLFGTALPIIYAKDKGILKQYMLIPIPLSALFCAHVAVRVILALIQASMLILISHICFGVPINGGILELILVYTMCAAVMITCGYALAGRVNSFSLANSMFGLLSLYILGFGQIFTDMRNIPIAGWLIYTTPASSVSDLLRQVLLQQWANLSIGANFAILFGWMLAAYWLGLRKFKFLTD